MRSLAELLVSAEGRGFLEEAGVLAEPDRFVARLRPPVDPGLIRLVGVSADARLVYTAHQVKMDYEATVTAKLRTTADLGGTPPEVSTVFLWLDTDRTGADKRTAGFQLHGRGGTVRLRFASRRHDDKEPRFVPVDRRGVDDGLRRLGVWARQHGAPAVERRGRVAAVLSGDDMETLADAGMAVTQLLLREHLGIRGPAPRISRLGEEGLLTKVIDDAVNHIDDMVTVFNTAVDSLLDADVDPQVHHLAEDYLPLNYSCGRDDRRCRLTHERTGADHFAVTTCSCGAEYRFHLGSRSLTVAEVAGAGRWSTDVMLPAWLNDLASGVVAGRSSALYGIALNRVLEKVLGRAPIPMLVPGDLIGTPSAAASDSLMQDYLLGG